MSIYKVKRILNKAPKLVRMDNKKPARMTEVLQSGGQMTNKFQISMIKTCPPVWVDG